MTVNVRLGKVAFSLDLNHKITYVEGDSSAGKTHLCNIISQPGVKIQSNHRLVPLLRSTEFMMLDAYKSSDRVIFFVDEDFKVDSLKSFIDFIKSTDHIWVFFNRRHFDEIPCDLKSILEFKLVKGIRQTKQVYSNIIGEQQRSHKIYTEDKKSFNILLNSICNQDIFSADGKDNIRELIFSQKNSLFIVDGLGFGNLAPKLKSSLENSTNWIYAVDSFEKMLLDSEFCQQNKRLLPDDLEDILRPILKSTNLEYIEDKTNIFSQP